MKNVKFDKRIFSFGAISAAIAATLCCIAPLILFVLGISGAWISNLIALEPYKPYFLIAALIFVTLGFWQAYKKPSSQDCKPGTFCARPVSDKFNKIMLFVATGVILLTIIYPYIAPFLLSKL